MIIKNTSATYEYTILNKLEVGIELKGSEIKSIRSGMCSLKGSWVDIKDNELWIKNMHITKYDNLDIIDPERDRKLLAHKEQIRNLERELRTKGITLIPLDIHFVRGMCKIELGICKGNHSYDKRENIKKRETDREIARAVKKNNS